MTISDAAPHNWQSRPTPPAQEAPAPHLLDAPRSSLDFTIGPEASPLEAMERVGAMAALTLPRFLASVPDCGEVCAAAQAVLTELVDVTARHRASLDLVGRVLYDGAHVTLSIGDMSRTLPSPEEEPGLYLVHRLAVDAGQYAGDMGGMVTWAAVAIRA
ncbi:hypothetical protein [Streptomyces hirsutus]|uniref:hypothetical protein n=1 Tax=Streptomyces hirsutus TaxID=35620 RepID=UPI003320AA74